MLSFISVGRILTIVEQEPVRPNSDNKPGPSMTEFATPIACVSAFCRAVMQKLVPNDLLGVGEDGQKNRDVILRQVDSFVRMRRFESPSLHEVAQGLKVNVDSGTYRFYQPLTKL